MLLWLMLAGGVFPSGTSSSWMEPAAFHLELGDQRKAIEDLFSRRGWNLNEGKGRGQLVHQYDPTRTVTLGFRGRTLTSIRFELNAFLPEARKAYQERKERLDRVFGESKSLGSWGRHYSGPDFDVHLVVVDGGEDSGGAGTLVVRYFVREAV